MKKHFTQVMAGVLAVSMIATGMLSVNAETILNGDTAKLGASDTVSVTETITCTVYAIQTNTGLAVMLSDGSMKGFACSNIAEYNLQQGDEITVTYVPMEGNELVLGSIVSITKAGEEITTTTPEPPATTLNTVETVATQETTEFTTNSDETTAATEETTEATTNSDETTVTTEITAESTTNSGVTAASTEETTEATTTTTIDIGGYIDSYTVIFKEIDANGKVNVLKKGKDNTYSNTTLNGYATPDLSDCKTGQRLKIYSIGTEMPDGTIILINSKIEYLFGDVSRDNKISVADIVAMANVMVGKLDETEYKDYEKDFNDDGKFNTGDLVDIAKTIVGTINLDSFTNQETTIKSGVWLAKSSDGTPEDYYFINGADKTGSFTNLISGVGLAFDYTISGNTISMSMGSADNVVTGSLEYTDDNMTITLEDGSIMNLSYENDKTQDEFTFFSNQELEQMALNYYASINNGVKTSSVASQTNADGTVTIQLYDLVEDHNSTADWYTVDRFTAKGTNILGDAIDLNVPAVG